MRPSVPTVNSNHQRYKGFKPVKMDPKYRVSVQPSWRPEPGASLFLLFSKDHDMPVVKVLSQEAYDQKVSLIENSDKTPVEKGKTLGKLAMLCREVALNDQGKLLVPKDLSEKSGIDANSEVTLAGRGLHFEIWSKANFDKVLEIETQQEEDDDLGIF
jgi:DNA-binding transcriptional regulator/RsmH inhibitor MraZ